MPCDASNWAADKAELSASIDQMKSDFDSMSEMGEMESLRLQMAMDRLSKMMSTLSNVLHGKRHLTRDHIRRLAKHFEVDPGVFHG